MTDDIIANDQTDKAVNIPNQDIPKDPLKLSDLDDDLRERINTIQEEFIRGLNFIRQHKHSVTFFGSARLGEDNTYYQKAVAIAKELAEEGIDIVTGGGPGIMEAANRGADIATGVDRGSSLGLNIKLPQEQILNPYVEKNEAFHYFFSRKVALTFSAEAYLVFPGGLGTLDEFFEILTLVQTEKIEKVPIVLVGSDFWSPLTDFIETTLKDKHQTISDEDTELYQVLDDNEKIVEIAKNAPLRSE